MIASHEVKIGKTKHVLRLTTRAIMRLEEETDQAFFDLIGAPHSVEDLEAEKTQTRYKIGTIVAILGAAMNDGAGADKDAAIALYENLGYGEATVALAEVIAKAFGDEDGEQAKADDAPDGAAPEGNEKAA